MEEAQLIDFIDQKNCQYQWLLDQDMQLRVVLWVKDADISEFRQLFSPSFIEDGGVVGIIKGDCFGFNISYICKKFGIDPKNIFKQPNEKGQIVPSQPTDYLKIVYQELKEILEKYVRLNLLDWEEQGLNSHLVSSLFLSKNRFPFATFSNSDKDAQDIFVIDTLLIVKNNNRWEIEAFEVFHAEMRNKVANFSEGYLFNFGILPLCFRFSKENNEMRQVVGLLNNTGLSSISKEGLANKLKNEFPNVIIFES